MLFGFGLVVLLLTGVAALIAQGLADDEIDRRRARPKLGPQGEIILERDPASRASETLTPAVFAEGALLILTSPLRANAPILTYLAIISAALSVATLPEALRAWDLIQATDRTLSRKSLLGRQISIQWTEIAKVEYHRWRACLALRAVDGRSIRVDVAFKGFSTFVSLLADRLPLISREALHRLPIAHLEE